MEKLGWIGRGSREPPRGPALSGRAGAIKTEQAYGKKTCFPLPGEALDLENQEVFFQKRIVVNDPGSERA